MTLQQFIQYLASGGAVILGAALISWLAENVPQFQALTAGAKQAAMVAVCLALALGAWAVQAYVPASVLADLAAPFGIVVATTAALLGNQAWHTLVNKSGLTVEIHHNAVDAPPAAPSLVRSTNG